MTESQGQEKNVRSHEDFETLQEWVEIWQSQVTENLSPESPGSGSSLGGEGLARPWSVPLMSQ